jgi:hypothetical protein
VYSLCYRLPLGFLLCLRFAPEDKGYNFFFIFNRVRESPLGTAATIGLFYQPQMIDDGDCGAIGGMKIGREI